MKITFPDKGSKQDISIYNTIEKKKKTSAKKEIGREGKNRKIYFLKPNKERSEISTRENIMTAFCLPLNLNSLLI